MNRLALLLVATSFADVPIAPIGDREPWPEPEPRPEPRDALTRLLVDEAERDVWGRFIDGDGEDLDFTGERARAERQRQTDQGDAMARMIAARAKRARRAARNLRAAGG